MLPLATFAMGVVTSYAIQRYWRKRDLLQKQVDAIVQLTGDWYNQLVQLRLSSNEGKRINGEAIDKYVRERLILPKLLYSIAVLRERRAYMDLREAADEFLHAVTITRASSYVPAFLLRGAESQYSCNTFGFLGVVREDVTTEQAFDTLLAHVASIQQRIITLAAKAAR
jgi:hypothetical protein